MTNYALLLLLPVAMTKTLTIPVRLAVTMSIAIANAELSAVPYVQLPSWLHRFRCLVRVLRELAKLLSVALRVVLVPLEHWLKSPCVFVLRLDVSQKTIP